MFSNRLFVKLIVVSVTVFLLNFSLIDIRIFHPAVAKNIVLIDGYIEENEYEQSRSFQNGDYELFWRFEDNSVVIGMRAKTMGWVALGIDPTEKMAQADMIFGWVESTGEVKMLDTFFTNGSHPPDEELGGTNDINVFTGTESGDYTTIEFQRKSYTGDPYDKTFPTTGTLKVIVAFSLGDSVTQKHVFRATENITVAPKKLFTELNPLDAKKLYDNTPSLLILDVSPSWKAAHLPGAINIEPNSITQNLYRMNKTRPVMVYCRADASAIYVAEILGNNGFSNVYRLLGNFEAWVKAGYPTEAYVEKTVIRFQIGNQVYWVDSVAKNMDTKPTIIQGRTMLPIRFLAEAIGARVNWNAPTQEIYIYLGLTEIKMQIGNPMALVNGKNVYIDSNNIEVKPIVVPPGRTLLPLRFVAESLNCVVDWNAQKQEISVSYRY